MKTDYCPWYYIASKSIGIAGAFFDAIMRGPRGYPSPTRRARAIYAEVGAARMAEHKPGFAAGFYVSWQWQQCRAAYIKAHPLCERCAAKGLVSPAEQVHHKIRLTPENLRKPEITLNPDNLEALCKACHRQEHRGTRWRCDEMGHVEI